MSTAALLLAVSLLSACARDQAGAVERWAGTREQLPNGSVLVSNPVGGAWSGDSGWTIEEIVRVGSVDGNGADVFGNIVALEIDAQGRMLLFDGISRELRIFSSDGRLQGQYGGKGGGPGEFESVIGMSLSDGGEVWLVDPANGRYTAISDNGNVRTLQRRIAAFRLPWLGGHTASGHFVEAATIARESGLADALLLLDANGMILDTAPLPNPAFDVPRRGRIEFPIPYGPSVLRAFDRRGYVLTALSSEYRFVRTTLTGDTVMIVTRDYGTQALSNSQKDSIGRYVQELTTTLGVQVPTSMLPRSAPVLRLLAVDDAGVTWVCRAEVSGCGRLDVIDESGLYLGEVLLPFRIRGSLAPIVRGNLMLAATESDYGVPYVVLARIVGR